MTTDQPVRVVAGTAVRFERISKSFGPIRVLDDISLKAPGGKTTCIVGPSGSGKSTLLRCTNRLEEPDSGRIWLSDQEITSKQVNVNHLRAQVGIVFQHFNLFPYLSALENLTLPLQKVHKLPRQAAEEQAIAQLAEVGLTGFEKRRPTQLSGGQQQRVAIARALAMRPKVMLFDEATSALDPELVKGVLDVVQSLVERGMTMLVVTHEMRFAREVASELVFLDAGRVVEHGPPEQLFSAPQTARLRTFLSQLL